MLRKPIASIVAVAATLFTFTLLHVTVVSAITAGSEYSSGINNHPDQGICQQRISNLNESAACSGANNALDNSINPASGKGSLLQRISSLVIILTGVVSVIMIIVGGFRYVISAGDSNGVKAAKSTIIYAVIGLVVALMAQAIITLILTTGVF